MDYFWNGVFSPNNLTLNCTYQPSPQDVLVGHVTMFLESTSNSNCLSEMDSVVVSFTDEPTVNAGVDQIVCINNSEIDLSELFQGFLQLEFGVEVLDFILIQILA